MCGIADIDGFQLHENLEGGRERRRARGGGRKFRRRGVSSVSTAAKYEKHQGRKGGKKEGRERKREEGKKERGKEGKRRGREGGKERAYLVQNVWPFHDFKKGSADGRSGGVAACKKDIEDIFNDLCVAQGSLVPCLP